MTPPLAIRYCHIESDWACFLDSRRLIDETHYFDGQAAMASRRTTSPPHDALASIKIIDAFIIWRHYAGRRLITATQTAAALPRNVAYVYASRSRP